MSFIIEWNVPRMLNLEVHLIDNQLESNKLETES